MRTSASRSRCSSWAPAWNPDPETAGAGVATARGGGAGVAAAFLLAAGHWAEGRAGRAACALAGTLLLASGVAAAWGDPSRRELSVGLDHEVRHEIAPGAEGLARLASVPEAWVFFD